jgi:hypothetical protein
MTEYPAYRGSYIMVDYNDSYFKFPTRASYKDIDRNAEFYANYISRIFIKEIKNKQKLNINARTLYMRGFYDYIADAIGEKECNELLINKGTPATTAILMDFAKQYNIVEKNPTTIKNNLLPFVKG